MHAVRAWGLSMLVVLVCCSSGAPAFKTLRAGQLRLVGQKVWRLACGDIWIGLEMELPLFGMSITVDKLKLNLFRHRQRFVPDVGAQF
uniref:Putative secreted protein n=1 Tax=Ixodes scapularis TaxID=6945 RepID=A0A4D5RZB7_IXOSC